MRKTRSAKKSESTAADSDKEYRFDYTKARRNRFAASFAAGSRVVVLDSDVAKVFTTGKSVNAVLRALLKTIPPRPADSQS